MLCNIYIVLQCFAGSFKPNVFALSLSSPAKVQLLWSQVYKVPKGCLKGWRLTISPSHPFVSLRPARGTIAKRCVPWSDFNPSHRDGVLEFWTTPWHIWSCDVGFAKGSNCCERRPPGGLMIIGNSRSQDKLSDGFSTRALAQVEENALEELAELVPEKKIISLGRRKWEIVGGDGFRSCGSDMRMVPFLRCWILQWR